MRSPVDTAAFARDGVVGPIEVLAGEQMRQRRDAIVQALMVETPASRSIYGFHTNRDAHLFSRAVFELVTHPRLVGCLVSLLGSDVLLWRTTFFYKPALGEDAASPFAVGEIDWHQGLDFMKPAASTTGLHPSLGRSRAVNRRAMPRNITAWVAIDDATESTGALTFVPGSQRLGPRPYVACEPESGFHGMGLRSDYAGVLDVGRAVTMPVAAGSCLLFDNLVYHRSSCNRSSRPRVGIACRYVANDVPVYPHGDPTGYDLSRWGCVQVAGVDRAGANKILDPSALALA